MPASVKVTIGRRLERLSAEGRETLALAAVVGQQFGFEVLLQASGVEEERLLNLLDQWLTAHLVVEKWDRAATRVPGNGERTASGFHSREREREERYRFQHALIREVLL